MEGSGKSADASVSYAQKRVNSFRFPSFFFAAIYSSLCDEAMNMMITNECLPNPTACSIAVVVFRGDCCRRGDQSSGTRSGA